MNKNLRKSSKEDYMRETRQINQPEQMKQIEKMEQAAKTSTTVLTEALTSYIDNHLQDNLSLNEIEKTFHYSKYYLNRIFLREKGETIYKYIQINRLNKAAKELVLTKRPIIEIAFEAGYDSQQSFTQAFHQIFLDSPYVYRKRNTARMAQTKIYAYYFCLKLLQQNIAGKEKRV